MNYFIDTLVVVEKTQQCSLLCTPPFKTPCLTSTPSHSLYKRYNYTDQNLSTDHWQASHDLTSDFGELSEQFFLHDLHLLTWFFFKFIYLIWRVAKMLYNSWWNGTQIQKPLKFQTLLKFILKAEYKMNTKMMDHSLNLKGIKSHISIAYKFLDGHHLYLPEGFLQKQPWVTSCSPAQS